MTGVALGDLVPVRVPTWAIANGMPRPEEGEMFNAYWQRAGVKDTIIASSFFGLKEQNADCANERMGTWLRNDLPEAFDRYVATLIEKWPAPEIPVGLEHALRRTS